MFNSFKFSIFQNQCIFCFILPDCKSYRRVLNGLKFILRPKQESKQKEAAVFIFSVIDNIHTLNAGSLSASSAVFLGLLGEQLA